MSDDVSDATEGAFETPKDQQDLISDLLSDEPAAEEETVEEEVIEEEVIEEEETKEEVEEETSKEEETVEEETEEEVEETAEEETETTDIEAITTERDRLQEQVLNAIEQGLITPTPTESKEEKEEPSAEEEETVVELVEPFTIESLEIGDLLSEEELESVVDHPETLNVAFKRAMEKVLESLTGTDIKSKFNALSKQVEELPQQVSSMVATQFDFATERTAFYTDNPDLAGKPSKAVDMMLRDFAGKAQKAGEKTSIRDLYNKAGDEVREIAGLPSKEEAAAKSDTPRKPALPGSKSSKRQPKQTPSVNKTQADLIAFVTSKE